jgi:hypothetical protein
MPKAIGSERMNPRSRTKALRDRGFMPTYTARKAIRATQLTVLLLEQPECFLGGKLGDAGEVPNS